MITIKEIMHGVTIISEDATVLEVAQIMEDKCTTAVLVESFGEVNGIITERDLVTKVMARAIDPRLVRASQIMTPIIYTIDAEEDITKAAIIMDRNNIRRLPVTKNGKIVGIVMTHDISKAMPYALHSRISSMRTMDRNHYPEF